MEWSPQQEHALQAVAAWIKDPSSKQVFYLAGYAGTGKTTLAKHLANDVAKVKFCAYTGKAAHVLRRKGCYDASTIHQLIYIPAIQGKTELLELAIELAEKEAKLRGGEDAQLEAEVKSLRARHTALSASLSRPSFTLNVNSEIRDLDLLVVDECSMVGKTIGTDLESFGTKLLVLGDPAQLPPVGDSGHWTGKKPDYLLTEIHRQAADNPIIHLATLVRSGRGLPDGAHGDSLVLSGKPDPDSVAAAGQVLVGRNATRHHVNRRVREVLGRPDSWLPLEGDRLVCLRNDHNVGLLNGSLWQATKVLGEPDDNTLEISVVSDESEHYTHELLAVHAHHLRGDPDEALPYWARSQAHEFDYGYALTCHKAQGSQWDDVMVFDESRAFRQNAARWLYTAITRAAERVTIIKGRS